MPLPMPPVPMKPTALMPHTSSIIADKARHHAVNDDCPSSCTAHVLFRHLGAPRLRRRSIHDEIAALALEHHAILTLRGFRRDQPLAHVGQYAFRRARQRGAVAAAARRVEAEDVA